MYQLTEKHIRNGQRGHCQYCPLALAVGENLKWKVLVCDIYLRKSSLKGSYTRYDFSRQVQDWIHRFDTEQKVEPFEFGIANKIIYMKHEFFSFET